MKSAYYTGAVTNAYRMALDALERGETLPVGAAEECEAVSHRPYGTGFYYGQPRQYYPDSLYRSTAEVRAVVVACDENGRALLRQRNKIRPGDRLELLLPGTDGIPFTVEELRAFPSPWKNCGMKAVKRSPIPAAPICSFRCGSRKPQNLIPSSEAPGLHAAEKKQAGLQTAAVSDIINSVLLSEAASALPESFRERGVQ